MLKKYAYLFWGIIILFSLSSCSEDDYEPVEPEPVSPVVFDIASVPYQNLSEYNFYEGDMSDLNPVYGVVPYTLINTLFTDYAEKQRFIWMPDGVSASYVSDNAALNFPVGSVLIKNFYYNNVLPAQETRVIETRLMINKESGWEFATYVWNEDQTEAVLDMNGSFTAFDWIDDGVTKSVNYRIPAGPECHTCHKIGNTPSLVGPKPRNMNMNYAFSDGTMNQLEKLIDVGYLEDNLPQNIETLVSWKDTSQSLDDRMRAYVDINCAHCHSENTHCDYRPMRLDFSDTHDPVNLGVCVEPDTDFGLGHTHIIRPQIPLRSMMYFRLNTTDESKRMPLLGRTMIHDEGVQLVEDYINSLQINCD